MGGWTSGTTLDEITLPLWWPPRVAAWTSDSSTIHTLVSFDFLLYTTSLACLGGSLLGITGPPFALGSNDGWKGGKKYASANATTLFAGSTKATSTKRMLSLTYKRQETVSLIQAPQKTSKMNSLII